MASVIYVSGIDGFSAEGDSRFSVQRFRVLRTWEFGVYVPIFCKYGLTGDAIVAQTALGNSSGKLTVVSPVNIDRLGP